VTELTGDNWSGIISANCVNKASGRVNGYAWYFQQKQSSWLIEIAEEQGIEPSDLPLVGYGCGGWLFESDKVIDEMNSIKALETVPGKIDYVVNLFKQNKLNYLPAVSCGCRD
jgi:hypothetical protein